MSSSSLKLSDEVIAQIARLVQVGILTGTDIVDNLRLMRLAPAEDELFPTDEYREQFDNNIDKMLLELQENGSFDVNER